MAAVCGVQQKAALQGFAAKQTARPSARPMAIRATAERKQQQKESGGPMSCGVNIAMEGWPLLQAQPLCFRVPV